MVSWWIHCFPAQVILSIGGSKSNLVGPTSICHLARRSKNAEFSDLGSCPARLFLLSLLFLPDLFPLLMGQTANVAAMLVEFQRLCIMSVSYTFSSFARWISWIRCKSRWVTKCWSSQLLYPFSGDQNTSFWSILLFGSVLSSSPNIESNLLFFLSCLDPHFCSS